MGRPRKFTEENALSEILAVFKQKGYEAASIDDITKASNLSRASLYGVFGSKEQVFREVLKVYMAEVIANMRTTVLGEAEPLAGLKVWLKRLPAYLAPNGCLLAVALAERPNLSKEVGADIDSYLNLLENQILQVLERAQEGGKLSKYIGSDFEKVGSKLVGLYFMAATLTRGCPNSQIAKDAIESTLRLVD